MLKSIHNVVVNYHSHNMYHSFKLKHSLNHRLLCSKILSRICESNQNICTLYHSFFDIKSFKACAAVLCQDRRHFQKQCYESTTYFISQKFFSLRSYNCKENEENADEALVSDEFDEMQYKYLRQEMLQIAKVNTLLIVQPYIKWGRKKDYKSNPKLKLQEAVALVESLQGWRIVDKLTIGLQTFENKAFFGSGNLDMIKKKIQTNSSITAIFISTEMLTGPQRREIAKYLGIPVYDRYTVVIQIFKQHAISREAKLQVAMAEIPYLRCLITDINEGTVDRQSSGCNTIGGAGETFIETRTRILNKYQTKLKHELNRLRNHRELLRTNRKKFEFPVVAIVGYTNAGKTSLIKALTGDSSLQPRNKLFATLDITNHMGVLPCRLKVLYVDTIGFITDIPTGLLEPFVATLEDAMLADVIVHVKDLSHPDKVAQEENVISTLKRFNLKPCLLENIITVGNKVDLIEDMQLENDMIPVSALKHTGLGILEEKIEAAVLHATGRILLTIRVLSGSEEASWLYKEAAVTSVEPDMQNNQYLLMHVIITETQLSRFRHYFINSSQ